MNRYLLDTSVGVKWFSQVGEADIEKALRLREHFRERRIELLVPELFFVEFANALRFNSRFTEKDVRAAVESIWAMQMDRAMLSEEALQSAVEVAYRYKVTLYDAVFIALAKSSQARLITADYSLSEKVGSLPDVIPLKNLPV